MVETTGHIGCRRQGIRPNSPHFVSPAGEWSVSLDPGRMVYNFRRRKGMAMTSICVVHHWTASDGQKQRLARLGDVTYFDTFPTSVAEVIKRIGGSEIAINSDVRFPAEVIESGPNLKMISVWATGHDNFDLASARRRGITVCNVPGYSRYSVSEHAWAMVLHLARKLGQGDAYVRKGGFDWSVIRGAELHGKTVGIIGTGAIGANSAAIARGFGCRVLAHTLHPSRERARRLRVTYVPLAELFSSSDIILPHMPLTSATHHLIDESAFALMKRKPIIVNTARGRIIEPNALLEALRQGQIAGIGLETLWEEPPDWTSPLMRTLMTYPNVVFSPHCAAMTGEAMDNLTSVCIDNIEAYLTGRPQNVVV